MAVEHLITATPFGFKNEKDGKVTGWGAKIEVGFGCTGDAVRIVSKHGVVRRGILSRIISTFNDKNEGKTYNAWSLHAGEE